MGLRVCGLVFGGVGTVFLFHCVRTQRLICVNIPSLFSNKSQLFIVCSGNRRTFASSKDKKRKFIAIKVIR